MSRFSASLSLLLTAFVIIYLLNTHVNAGRILFGYAPQAISHFRTMLPFIKRLAEAGHEITVFHTHKDATSFQSANVSIIPVTYKPSNDGMDELGRRIWTTTFHGFTLIIPTISMAQISHAYVKEHPTELRAAFDGDWDAIIGCSLFDLHMFAFAEIMSRERNIPYIVFHSTAILTSLSYQLAMEYSPSHIPSVMIPEPTTFDDNHNAEHFNNRLINAFEGWSELLANQLFESYIFSKPMKAYGSSDFSLNRFFGKMTFLLGDLPEFISYPAPQVVDYRSIGANCDKPKPLEGDLLEFVSDSTSKGTIYVAFGTIIPWDLAPEKYKMALFDALDTLTDYRIIFSYRGKFPLRKMPPHLRLVKWAPQLDVLAHVNTKLFITHGGLKSTKEGICARIPMLVMPMFAEQARNAKLIIKLGVGGALYKYNFTTNAILSGIQRVVSRADAFVAQVRKVHAMYIDRPLPDLDDGVFYVNRLIRLRRRAATKGSRSDFRSMMFFQRRSAYLSTITHLSLDALVIFFAICMYLSKK